ncbi:cob(I)yrinic acid a,c-diamide adenosyltransferase [Halogeometricum borinquense]|uniref:Cob(I)yrinic acid a,c-diamide adenosyltransferase n=1 Tax=Halogeometricum borinquense TaxID=60847 RepID=A0A6C0UFC6_9EURY|nr:cob(I)yrinic acid a,c-diamide adenosyltransferase [Halogeometricum borinquense]QIB73253.1 cob(I)yrinic acid a,c-diamide adenosyltransferase [Halogeometricum borinquense]QIQ77351.1 cob(I)yrinic acid a,c-diamide adenosyltransferase [Halogeometricum borinquense]
MSDERPDSPEETRQHTPGGGVSPAATDIEPAAPEEFGLVQAWWGDGKGKTTAALGMAFRAAGHGYRVHLLQFLKGGADSVESVRGEYNVIAALPSISYENTGHYGWKGRMDGSDDDEHAAKAQAAFDRTKELVAAAGEADLTAPLPSDGNAEDGVHMLVLDEILYAVEMGLLDADEVLELVESKPENLELVLTGGHEEPTFLLDAADLVSEVRKVNHPFDDGTRARKGTEY